MREEPTNEYDDTAVWPPSPDLIEGWLGGVRMGTCVVEPVGRMQANRQARGLAWCLAMITSGMLGLLVGAIVGPTHERAVFAVAILGSLPVAVFFDRVFRTRGGEYALRVRADGDGVSFAGPRRQVYVRWLDIVGIKGTEDRSLWQCADGSEVPVPAIANLRTMRQVAARVVALRSQHYSAQAQADEEQMRRMERGLSRAEDSKDAERGLSVSQ